MSNDARTAVLNKAFMTKVASAPDKLARATESIVEDHLREAAFVRGILSFRDVSPDDNFVKNSTHTDTLVVVVGLQPDSRAMVVDLRGRPDARLISGERVEVGFFTVSSELFQANEIELLSYDESITKRIEEQSALDIEEIEDREWVIHCDAAVQAMQNEMNGGAATALHYTTLLAGTTTEYSVYKSTQARLDSSEIATALPLLKQDLVMGVKAFARRRLRAEMVLVPDDQFADFMNWSTDEVGQAIPGETATDGWKSDKVTGLKYIRTVKSDILRPGNLFFFTAEKFLGRAYRLQKLKFWIDKDQDLIEWRAWEHIAMCLVNVGAVVKVETYSCDASGADANSLLDEVSPVTESAVGITNNRVEDGTYFPSVSFY